jgi:hypothetical protein
MLSYNAQATVRPHAGLQNARCALQNAFRPLEMGWTRARFVLLFLLHERGFCPKSNRLNPAGMGNATAGVMMISLLSDSTISLDRFVLG